MLGTHQKIIGQILGRFPPSDNPSCVPIILMVIDYLIRFSLGVRCVKSVRTWSEERQSRPDREYSTCGIFTIRNPEMWGEARGQTRACSGDYHVKGNHIQSESEMKEDGSIRNAVMAQHKLKLMWTAEMEDQLVDLWRKCLHNVLCKTFPNTIIAIASCISSAMLILRSLEC